VEYSPGLAGVPAARSKISYLDGQKGLLEYRGVRLELLARHSTFVETAYLLVFGDLPSPLELQRFQTDLTAHRQIKFRITDLMKCLPEGGHPMDALQAAVAALGMFYPAKNVRDRDVQYSSVVRLLASCRRSWRRMLECDAATTRFRLKTTWTTPPTSCTC